MPALDHYYTISHSRPTELPTGGFWSLLANKGIHQELKKSVLQFPTMQMWHECPPVYKDSTGDYQAIICTTKIARFHTNHNILWLSHTLFKHQATTDYIEVIVGHASNSTHHFWQRIHPAQWRTSEIDIDNEIQTNFSEQLALNQQVTHSSGTLYQYMGKDTQRPKLAQLPCFKLELNKNTEQQDNDPLQDVHIALNPFILSFDLDSNDLDPHQEQITDAGKQLINQYRNTPYLLDVLPVFSQKRSFQLRLHQELTSQWHHFSSHSHNWPLMPQLLFRSLWQPSYIPFLILDAFEGVFLIENMASPDKNQLFWQTENLSEYAQWIADWSIEKMDLIKHTHQAFPTIINNNDMDSQHYELIDKNDNASLSCIEKEIFFSFNHCLKGQNELEKEILMRLEAECKTDAGLLFEKFVSELGQKYLLPQSKIIVKLPTAPTILANNVIHSWNDYRNTHAIDITTFPAYAERWWLEMITPKENIKISNTVEQKWNANDASWWFLFYHALFIQKTDFIPIWRFQGSNRINQGRIGQIILGQIGNKADSCIKYLRQFSLS